jgi:hypothetical protein
MTFDDLVAYAKQEGVNEYLASQQPKVEIESMTDDEVFLTDLLTRVPDITDDEAQQALDLEKQNEQLYLKKVQALRADLIEKETTQ